MGYEKKGKKKKRSNKGRAIGNIKNKIKIKVYINKKDKIDQ